LASSFGTGLSSFGKGAGGGASRSRSSFASAVAAGSGAARSGSRHGQPWHHERKPADRHQDLPEDALEALLVFGETDHARIGVCR